MMNIYLRELGQSTFVVLRKCVYTFLLPKRFNNTNDLNKCTAVSKH